MSDSPDDRRREDRVTDSDADSHPDSRGETAAGRGADGPASGTAADRQGGTGDRADRGTADDDRRDTSDERTGRNLMTWMSALAALIGAWVVASPFVYDTTQIVTWNNVAVGAAILLIAGYNVYRSMDDVRPNVAGSSLVVLLGLWLVVAPFLLLVGSEAMGWSMLVSGLLVAVVGGYNAYESRRTEQAATTGTRA